MTTTPTLVPEVTGRRRSYKWRALVVASIGAIGLISGLTLAFGSQTTGTGASTGSASTGSVALVPGSPASTTCTYKSLLPGDLSGSQTCTFSVAYSGSLPAYVSLSVLIETNAGAAPGAQTLYDATANGLTMTIQDSQSSPVTYTVPTSTTNCPMTGSPWGAAPAGSTCYELDDELVSTSSISSPTTVVFTVTPMFPTTVQNPYQGGTATVSLMAQAVQSDGNPLLCTAPPHAGQPCAPSGSFAWS